MRREAELQAQIRDADPRDPEWPAAVARHVDEVRLYLDRPLNETALGRREPDELAALIESVHELDAALLASEQALRKAETGLRKGDRELYALKELYDELYAKHEAVIQSRSWRIVAAGRRIASVIISLVHRPR